MKFGRLFHVCIWSGWFTGVVLVDKPWAASLTMTSWLSWHSVYSIVGTLLEYALFICLGSGPTTNALSYLSSELGLKEITFEVLYCCYSVLASIKRFYMWIYAKRILGFFDRLAAVDTFGNPDEATGVYSFWKILTAGMFMLILRGGVVITHSIGVLIEPPSTHSIINTEQNWFRALNFWVQLGLLIFAMFGIYTAIVMITGLIIVAAEQMLIVFDDLCDQLEYVHRYDLIFEVRKMSITDTPRIKNSITSAQRADYSRVKLINRVEEVVSIFDEFDSIFGPLILALVSSSFIGILNGCNALFNDDRAPLRTYMEILMILSETFVLYFMDLGHRATLRVSFILNFVFKTLV